MRKFNNYFFIDFKYEEKFNTYFKNLISITFLCEQEVKSFKFASGLINILVNKQKT